MGDYIVKVEEARPAANGKPSAGPVYRSIYAKDGLMEIPPAMDSPWDFFRYVICYGYLSVFLLFFLSHTH